MIGHDNVIGRAGWVGGVRRCALLGAASSALLPELRRRPLPVDTAGVPSHKQPHADTTLQSQKVKMPHFRNHGREKWEVRHGSEHEWFKPPGACWEGERHVTHVQAPTVIPRPRRLGGEYGGSRWVALLRQALPLAMCELCFRDLGLGPPPSTAQRLGPTRRAPPVRPFNGALRQPIRSIYSISDAACAPVRPYNGALRYSNTNRHSWRAPRPSGPTLLRTSDTE